MRSVFRARVAARFVPCAVLLATASCAAPRQAGAPAPSAAAGADAGGATVLVVRPIVPAVMTAGAGGWRALMLNGVADPAAPQRGGGGGLAEFIVRLDSGPTLSVVQVEAGWPRAGDRVNVARPAGGAGRPTLTRLL